MTATCLASMLALAGNVASATERHPMGDGLSAARPGFPLSSAACHASSLADAVRQVARTVATQSEDAAVARARAMAAASEQLEQAASATTPLLADGAAFEDRRGTLLLPLYFRPFARFGDQRDPRTGTSERHTGWSWGRTGDVVAATDGVVVRTVSVAGWGQMVVLSHGPAAHTIYAQLTEVTVARGDVVARGETLGIVDVVYDDNSTLYFELRIHGLPVDPAPWWRL